MSGIQLSNELVSKLHAVVVEHDAEANNEMLFMQYLTAVTGFVLAHQKQPGLDKQEFVNDLAGFMGQVMRQVEGDSQPQAPQEGAFGIWKPE
ncbi:MAG: mediator of RNA polymerase II transcription subunit 6 [Gammaproteobacteria bacterium]|nr:mediator of RNA polymerase II transcription subunit 6 [Gammaproteobacteria bacterium]